jgi:PhnB protein
LKAIDPYLNFEGNAEEAFNFYKSVFGGDFRSVMRWKDMPDSEKLPADQKEKIMHISLPLGNGNHLMASDAVGQKLTTGNNFGITISADNKEEADRLFNGLSKGGKVNMPMADAFWGDYFGAFDDKYGVQWMIVCDNKKD